MIRNPAVAGVFYSGVASELETEVKRYSEEKAAKEKVIGVVMPHAGYVFSGPVAGAVASRIEPSDVFVVLGPKHTPWGAPYSIMTQGSWKTPLDEVKIDSELAGEILAGSGSLKEDVQAHLYEHSIEVELPFLQYLKRDFKFVPLALSGTTDEIYRVYGEIGRAIAQAIKKSGKEVPIIASSDMTHYEPYESAKRKDDQAMEAILKLDEEELLKRVEKFHITMCGYAPTVCMLRAAKELGAEKAELVKYQTSAETSGDYSKVVGYAGIIVK